MEFLKFGGCGESIDFKSSMESNPQFARPGEAGKRGVPSSIRRRRKTHAEKTLRDGEDNPREKPRELSILSGRFEKISSRGILDAR